MNPQAFQLGEVVEVHIDLARVAHLYGEPGTDLSSIGLRMENPNAESSVTLVVPVGWPGVTINRTAPAEWPPAPGDVWQDSGGDWWFLQQFVDRDSGETLHQLVCENAKKRVGVDDHDYTAQSYGPMQLVLRKQVDA